MEKLIVLFVAPLSALPVAPSFEELWTVRTFPHSPFVYIMVHKHIAGGRQDGPTGSAGQERSEGQGEAVGGGHHPLLLRLLLHLGREGRGDGGHGGVP